MPNWGLFAVGDSLAAPLVCALVTAAIFLPGALTGITLVRRRDYLTGVGWAVTAVWTALGTAAVAAVLGAFAWKGHSEAAFLRSLAIVGGVASWSAAIIAVTCGSQALGDATRRERREQPPLRGNGASLAAIIFSVLVLLSGVYAGYEFGGDRVGGGAATADAANGPQRTTSLRPVLPADDEDRVDAVPFAGRAFVDPPERNWLGQVTRQTTAAPDDGPSVIEFKTLNLRFHRPGGSWCRADAPAMNSSAQVAYVDQVGDRAFVAIAERIGAESQFTSADLLDVARTHQRDGLDDVRFEEPVEHQLSGVPGLLAAATYRSDGVQRTIWLWAAVRNGFAVQLLYIGSPQPAACRDDALAIFKNYEPVDPREIAHTAPFTTAAGDRTLGPFSIAVKLRSTPWRIWKDYTSFIETAEFGALLDLETAFVVVPVRLTVPVGDRESTAAALFSMTGLSFQSASQGDRNERVQGSLPVDEWHWRDANLNGEIEYLARVGQSEHCAYLLVGYCPVDRPDRLAALREGLDAVLIDVSQPPSDAGNKDRRRDATALFYNELGLHHYYRDAWPETFEFAKQALALVPTHPTYLENLVQYYLESNRTADALKVLDGAASRLDGLPELQARRAELMADNGRLKEGLQAYADLFSAGHRDDAVFRTYVELLSKAGRHEEAALIVPIYRSGGDSSDLVLLEAATLQRGGQGDRAVQLLENRLAEFPHDEDAAYELVRAYRKLERYRDALTLIESRLVEGDDPTSAYYWKSLIQYDLSLFREAKASIEKAHQLDPDNSSIESLREYVNAALGEGENFRIRTPIEPVPMPAALAAAVPTAPVSDDFKTAAALYLDRTTVYRFVPDEELTRTEYFVFEVQNEQGVADFNTLTMKFDPLSEEVYVNRLEVFDADGELTAAGKTSDYYVLDDSLQGMAVHDKILEMPVPGVHAGCRVELVVTVRRVSGPTHFPFKWHVFGMTYPCRREALAVIGDESLLAAAGSAAADKRRAGDCIWWQVEDRAPYRSEPLSPDVVDSEPTLYLADRRTAWDAEAEDYLEEIADRLAIPDVVRRTAEEQTAGLADRAAKIAKLADFVRRTVSYKAVEFGRRSRIMHPADRTLADRYGDCKDMSLLLAQLLSSVGVAAKPALIHSENPLQESLGSLDQFDHMIVYLPDDEDPRAVDATDRYADPRQPVPLSFAGKRLFVLDGEKSRIETLPKLDADSYRADITRRVQFDADGNAHVVESIKFDGYYAGAMRQLFSYFPADDRRSRWQSYLESGGIAPVVRKFSLENLERRDQPLIVATEYEVERALLPAQGGRLGTIPAPLELMTFNPEQLEKRRLPVEIRYPMRLRSETIVVAPPECALPDAANLGGDLHRELFDCRLTATPGDDGLRLVTEIDRTAAIRPAAFYDEYCRSSRSVRHTAAPVVYFPSK